jgi:hypothetical protein
VSGLRWLLLGERPEPPVMRGGRTVGVVRRISAIRRFWSARPSPIRPTRANHRPASRRSLTSAHRRELPLKRGQAPRCSVQWRSSCAVVPVLSRSTMGVLVLALMTYSTGSPPRARTCPSPAAPARPAGRLASAEATPTSHAVCGCCVTESAPAGPVSGSDWPSAQRRLGAGRLVGVGPRQPGEIA